MTTRLGFGTFGLGLNNGPITYIELVHLVQVQPMGIGVELPTRLIFGRYLTARLGFGTFGAGLSNGHRYGIELITMQVQSWPLCWDLVHLAALSYREAA